MPPAIVNLGSSANPDINLTTNISNYSGTSWTPPSTGLLIVFVHTAVTAGSPAVPIVEGNNLLFYQIQTVLGGASSGHRLTLFGANLTGSITGVTGVRFAASQLCCRTSFFYASGTSVDFSNGVTGSFVQSPTNSATAGTTGTVTLAAAGNENNRPIVSFIHLANEAKTPRTNWTELDDLAGSAPVSDNETQFRGDAFETTASATWATSAAWAGIASEIKAVVSAQSYDDTVSVSRKESVSDSMVNSIQGAISLAQVDGVSEGMGNSIPKDSALNKVLTLSDLAGVGVFPALTLIQILSTTSVNLANMQGSVGLSGNLGIGGDPQQNMNPNASLLSVMGVSLSGGLTLLSDLTIAEKLGISALGNVSIYPSLTLGRDLAFVPANIALIGGNVSIGQSLGLIDVPNLNAQAALSFLQSLGISLSSALSTQTVEAALALAEKLGINASAQLSIFPLVGINQKLFLVDANNANMFGSNVLSEIRALNILGGISIQENVVIPIDFNLLTSKLVSIFGNVSVSDRLGISDSAIANMQAAIALGEVAGMGNAVNQILNAGLGISIVGSVLTISGLNVIIVKGFVFTSDSAKNSLSTSDYSRTASGSDSAKSSAETGDS